MNFSFRDRFITNFCVEQDGSVTGKYLKWKHKNQDVGDIINYLEIEISNAEEAVRKGLENMKKLTIICPFCNAPYTASMTEQLDASSESGSCSNCASTEITGSIEIKCDNCGKIVYKKEIDETR